MQEITSDNFEQEVMQSKIPVFIDMWATWCGPCKMASPIFESVSESYTDRIKFVKMDIENAPKIAEKYNIQAVPTFLLIKDGKEIGRKAGVISKSEMSMFASAAL